MDLGGTMDLVLKPNAATGFFLLKSGNGSKGLEWFAMALGQAGFWVEMPPGTWAERPSWTPVAGLRLDVPHMQKKTMPQVKLCREARGTAFVVQIGGSATDGMLTLSVIHNLLELPIDKDVPKPWVAVEHLNFASRGQGNKNWTTGGPKA